MSGIFRSLRFYNFRLFFAGGLISNTGTWMQAAAMSWVILTELSDNDATLVGLAFMLQYLPPLLLAPASGWVIDRFPRRGALITLQSLMLIQAFTIGILLLTGALTVPWMLILVGAQGLFAAFEVPLRQTLVTDLVASTHESNAIALNSATFNIARLIGPALGGVLIVVIGSGWVFLLNGISFVAALAALILMRPGQIKALPPRDGSPRLWGGLAYIFQRKDLLALTLCMFLVSAYTVNVTLTTVTMAVVFDTDAAGFGFINTVLAVGSLGGALTAAQRPRASYRAAAAALLAVGVLTGLSSIAPTYPLYLLAMVPLGYAIVFVLATANAYVQSTTARDLRGRVLAAYMAMLMGGAALGSLGIGYLADLHGARWAVGVGAVLAVITFVALMSTRRHSRTNELVTDPAR